jgi:hypothetical protein
MRLPEHQGVFRRSVTLLLLVGLSECLAVPAAAADPLAKMQRMFDAHCYNCHDADAKKGGLDLEALKWKLDDAETLQQWTKVFDKVARGEMPPKDKKRPTGELSNTFLKSLGGDLHDFSLGAQQRDGRVVYRRLNRTEYEHTLQDLLGIDTALRDLLPEDGTLDGFDNVGSALNLSAVHLERYMQAADLALKEATSTGPRPATTKIRTDYEETWKDWGPIGFSRILWTRSPEGGLAIRSLGGSPPHGGLLAWRPPVPGERYRFRIRAKSIIDRDSLQSRGANKAAPDRRVMLKVYVGASHAEGKNVVDFFEMTPDGFREFTVEIRIQAGQTIFMEPFRAVPEKPDEKAMNASYAAAIEWIEIEGPLFDTWPSRGHRLLYGDLPIEKGHVISKQPEADARRLLAAFLTKAFRRPVTEPEVADLLGFMSEEMKKGQAFDEALRGAYKLALCSPRFLFLSEKPGALNDHALAARLSYALWSTAPDEELVALAARNKLHEPATLRAQTERLLASPKAARFTQNFLGGWLNLRDIDFTQPDTKLYPEFEVYLQRSMMRETTAFFDEMLRHDLSVRNVVHSDFAMLNERLAEHYGIAGVKGPDIRKVALPANSHRGGFLTQGAVLKVSANGTTTSPVVRGAYVLDRILGTPPDPPPKNVAAIEPDIRGTTTIREQLDKHRNQTVCAGCHAKLDPPGFALESFDVTGRWRTNYRAIPDSAKDKIVGIPGSDIRLYIDGPKVDPSYKLADGREFLDVDAFKQLLLAHPEQIAHCMTEKLITYLTGARVQFADREVVEAIVKRAASNHYGLRTLVHEVIQSRVFTHK